MFQISERDPVYLFKIMSEPQNIDLIGTKIPVYFPFLLVILLIANFWNLYAYLKSKIGYDAYFSDSDKLYSKLDKSEISQDSQNEQIIIVQNSNKIEMKEY